MRMWTEFFEEIYSYIKQTFFTSFAIFIFKENYFFYVFIMILCVQMSSLPSVLDTVRTLFLYITK